MWENWNQGGRGWLGLVAPNEYPWVDMEIECSYVALFPFDSIEEMDNLIDWYWAVIFGS